MATANDVVNNLTGLHTTIAAREATRSTGVTPGFNARLGGTVTPDGRLRYVSSGTGGLGMLALSYVGTTQTIPAGTDLDVTFTLDSYDPGSVFDNQIFTAPADGGYAFTLNVRMSPDSALITQSNRILWDVIVNGLAAYELAYFEAHVDAAYGVLIIPLIGRQTVFLDAGDSVVFNCSNATDSDLSMTSSNFNSILIERLS